MPSNGSTTKRCVFCHTQLGVACKTCKACKAEQPRKLRLKKKMDRFDQKRDSWVHSHQKNRTVSHIRDEAHMLLEKLQALGIRAVLLMARPVRKTNAWQSEVLTPRCELSETSSTFLQRMKDVYNIVVKGWTPQGAAGQLDESFSARVELPAGPRAFSADLQAALSLLDPQAASSGPLTALSQPPAAPVDLPAALFGQLRSTIGHPAALLRASAHHEALEQPTLDLQRKGHPEASQVFLEKGGLREIKTEAGNSRTPLYAPATSSLDIKTEPEDIETTSNHTADRMPSPVLLVTVTDAGFVDGGLHTKSQSVMDECKYRATTCSYDAAELQAMQLDTRIPQTTQASNIPQSFNMVEAPSCRPSTSCDLDTMDLDQLRREKLKMQIKVLRLQEEHYALIVEGHKT
ncbi:uncharacterized protein LOC115575732 [Sparus aurata]|uniref:uncharacterized protein LOC115575732 n=1 Tax=Sparus aurata TaxID=8175 RepID=UPI0011C1BC66|nr:uncharacterized protein LOC115575732 [Sparus aurata]XP_030263856.1 uncharacterized protein LOC115575732 [Sparus aurata]XP_030263857.1 uncharacterized protein LOC115575732 [Sparus aurata]XP_030263858.1 uncharacterized protein LOC115575732 [Sparus aurata]